MLPTNPAAFRSLLLDKTDFNLLLSYLDLKYFLSEMNLKKLDECLNLGHYVDEIHLKNFAKLFADGKFTVKENADTKASNGEERLSTEKKLEVQLPAIKRKDEPVETILVDTRYKLTISQLLDPYDKLNDLQQILLHAQIFSARKWTIGNLEGKLSEFCKEIISTDLYFQLSEESISPLLREFADMKRIEGKKWSPCSEVNYIFNGLEVDLLDNELISFLSERMETLEKKLIASNILSQKTEEGAPRDFTIAETYSTFMRKIVQFAKKTETLEASIERIKKIKTTLESQENSSESELLSNVNALIETMEKQKSDINVFFEELTLDLKNEEQQKNIDDKFNETCLLLTRADNFENFYNLNNQIQTRAKKLGTSLGYNKSKELTDIVHNKESVMLDENAKKIMVQLTNQINDFLADNDLLNNTITYQEKEYQDKLEVKVRELRTVNEILQKLNDDKHNYKVYLNGNSADLNEYLVFCNNINLIQMDLNLIQKNNEKEKDVNKKANTETLIKNFVTITHAVITSKKDESSDVPLTKLNECLAATYGLLHGKSINQIKKPMFDRFLKSTNDIGKYNKGKIIQKAMIATLGTLILTSLLVLSFTVLAPAAPITLFLSVAITYALIAKTGAAFGGGLLAFGLYGAIKAGTKKEPIGEEYAIVNDLKPMALRS